MKKQIKIYVHHNHFESVIIDKPLRVSRLVFSFVTKLGKSVFEVCYAAGLIILAIIGLPEQLIKMARRLPSQFRSFNNTRHLPHFRRTVAVFTLLAITGGLLIQAAGLIAAGQNLKGRVLGTSDAGLSYLAEAQQALEQSDTTLAEQNFSKALEQFQSSEAQLKQTSAVLQGLMSVVPQKQDADRILEAARLMTEAGIAGTQAFTISKQMSISPEGITGGNLPPAESLSKLEDLVRSATEKLVKASEDLADVNITSLPEDKRAAFASVRDLLTSMQGNFSTLQDVFDLMFGIVSGQKNILIIFQNNNELRATGGFIGTVGQVKLNDGAIKHLDIRSVYDLDGQMHDWILPPKPMYAVNDRWYLRDSNWFADFPQTATELSSMYEKEGGETPDMVISLTPDFIIDLLNQVGPITLPQYGTTLNADNFVETIQTTTSVAYDKNLNQPKQLLADFFPVLMQKLGDPAQGGLVKLLGVLQSNLHQKRIMLYSRDAALQKKIEAFNWGGVIHSTDRDYLNIVSSNLGGTKTDRSLQKKLELESSIDNSGTVTDTIKYTVTNPLPKSAGLENLSFVRFLVPKGAHLQSSAGFSDVSLPRLEGDKYKSDDDITAWENNLSQNPISGTYSGEEAGKTFFGNWIKVAGGESRTVTLTYTLPTKISNSDRFSLLLQYQPGAVSTPYTYTVKFPGRTLAWQSQSSSSAGNNSVSFSDTLQWDRFIGLALTRN